MEDFIKELVEKLEELLYMSGDEVFIDLVDVCKTNDTVLHSIVIKTSREQISKNIYVEPYFAMNMRGTSVEEIAQNIIEFSNDKSYEEHIKENLIDVNDYDAVKEKIILRLVSKELNETFLEDKLYVPVGKTDLVAVFYVLMTKDDSGISSTAASNKYIDSWKVESVESLYEQALSNTMKIFPPMVRNMATFAKDKLGCDEVDEAMIEAAGDVMHILSNDTCINGATSMLYKGILKEFAEVHNVDEIVILPSSRHEVILLPQFGEIDYRYCDEMVKEINKCVVDHMDVLSNHIYIYDLHSDEVSMWSE